MEARAIVIKDNEVSENGFKILKESSEKVKNDFEVKRFDAITPDRVDELMEEYQIKWNYPWEGEVVDFGTGLKKKSYPTGDPKKRIACALSHYMLWKESVDTGKTLLILEHDAVFQLKMDFDISRTLFKIVGINNPLMCTRKARLYYQLVKDNQVEVQAVPWIDSDRMIPQGLAGNSAYIITPTAANDLIEKIHEPLVGMWPNDALMCRQLFHYLGVTRKFYTSVQGLPSTTTL